MNTYSEHILISIERPKVGYKIVEIPYNAEDKDWAMRKLLHGIFSDFRKGYDGKVYVLCHNEEEEYIAESYFWEESLALLGTRDEVKKYRHTINTIPESFWYAVFNCKDELSKQRETPFIEEGEYKGFVDELLALCKLDYMNWHQFFNLRPDDYSKINDLYALCAESTFIGRVPHWTDKHCDNSEILKVIEAIYPAYQLRMERMFLRTIEELHKMGYEKIRIVPSMAPTGLAWRCTITTKQNTSNKCGAMMGDHFPWNSKEVYMSNGMFPWKMMELSPYDNALKFIKEFPVIAKGGKGCDHEYAQWFKKVIRECYHYRFPISFEEYWNCMEDHCLHLTGYWPSKENLPFPPPGDGKGLCY